MVVELNFFNVRMTYPDYTPADDLCQVLFADFLTEILAQQKEKSNTCAETVPDMQCAFLLCPFHYNPLVKGKASAFAPLTSGLLSAQKRRKSQ
jgi:hypothetical protein